MDSDLPISQFLSTIVSLSKDTIYKLYTSQILCIDMM